MKPRFPQVEPHVILGLALQALAIPKLKLRDIEEAIRFVLNQELGLRRYRHEIEMERFKRIPLRLAYPQLLPENTRHYQERFKEWAKANPPQMVDWEKQTLLEIHIPRLKAEFVAYLAGSDLRGKKPPRKKLEKSA